MCVTNFVYCPGQRYIYNIALSGDPSKLKPGTYYVFRIIIASLFSLIFASCGNGHDGHSHGNHDHGTSHDDHGAHDHGSPGPDLGSEEDVASSGVDVPPPAPRVSIVDMFSWAISSPESDLWVSSAPVDGVCDETAIKGETTPDGDWFDVNTTDCDYVTVVQPLLAEIAEGTELHIGIYHFVLESAEGPFKLGVAIGEPAEVVWEIEYEPNGDSGTIKESWAATRSYALGEPVYYHVSNHGSNNWSLTELSKSVSE